MNMHLFLQPMIKNRCQWVENTEIIFAFEVFAIHAEICWGKAFSRCRKILELG
jgi:hypothetical protein